MNLHVEKHYPTAAALVVASTYGLYAESFPRSEIVLTSSLSLGAIFSGFLATAKGIQMGLRGPVARMVKESKYLGILMSYHRSAIFWSLGFCILCFGGLFLDPLHPFYVHWFGRVWTAVFVAMILAFLRVTIISFKVWAFSMEAEEVPPDDGQPHAKPPIVDDQS